MNTARIYHSGTFYLTSNLDVVNIEVRLINMDADECKITLGSKRPISSVFQIDNKLEIFAQIKAGERRIFVGRVKKVQEFKSGGIYGVTVALIGLFEVAKLRVFTISATDIDNASYLTTEFNYTAVTTQTLLSTIMSRLDAGPNTGFTYGGDQLNTSPIHANFKGESRTYADLIRAALRLHPQAIMRMNYAGAAGSPTTLIIRDRDTDTSPELSSNIDISLNTTENHDYIIQYARILFKMPVRRDLIIHTQGSTTTETLNLFRVMLEQQSGSLQTARTWYERDARWPLNLTITNLNWLIPENNMTMSSWMASAGGTPYSICGQLIKNLGGPWEVVYTVGGGSTHYFSPFGLNHEYFERADLYDATGASLNSQADLWFPYQPEMNAPTGILGVDMIASGSTIRWRDAALVSQWRAWGSNQIQNRRDSVKLFRFENNANPGGRNVNLITNHYNLPIGTFPNPPNIAETITQSFIHPILEGNAEQRVENFVNSLSIQHNSLRGVLQIQEISLATGRVTLQFGQSDHISPDDLMSFLLWSV